MTPNQLNYIIDGGHGWLEVPLIDLFGAGIYRKISGYSHVSDTHAYLEHDCDAALYLDAVGRDNVELNRIRVRTFPADYRAGIVRIDSSRGSTKITPGHQVA